MERQQRNESEQDQDEITPEPAGKSRKRKKKEKEKRKKKRKLKAAAPPLDTSMAALEESAEQEVARQSPSASSSRRERQTHSKTRSRQEEVFDDMVALLDLADDDDSYDDEIDSVSKRGSDDESVISVSAYIPNMSYQPKTPRKRNSVSSNNSALNTPTVCHTVCFIF